jgi:hypothetical protein
MSSTQDPTKAPTTKEVEKENDTVAETIAYARRTYKGGQKEVKVEPEKYVPPTSDLEPDCSRAHSNGRVKKLLNNVSIALMSNRYGGSGGT